MVTLRPPLRTALALVSVAAVSGCSVPKFEGPQIQAPPRGYLLQNDSWQNRRMFPDREVSMHTAWINAANGPYSGIYINAHAGSLGIEEVAAAQDAARGVPENHEVTYGEIEALTIDGRTAWGWAERLHTAERGLDWVAYRTVVSYDTVSYAIEFYSGDPATKLAAPDTLRAVVATFAIGQIAWNFPLIALLAGVLLIGYNAVRNKQAEKMERLRSINLVQVKKAEGDGEVDLSDEPTRPAPRASSVRPPAPPAAPTQMRRGDPESST